MFMNRVQRRSVLLGLGICVAALGLAPLAAEPAQGPGAPPETKTPAGDPPLQQILDRLNRVERELLELRIKSGQVPADKNEQRVLTLIETPYLGGVYGTPMNQRFFAVKLMLVNLTDQPATLARDDVQLSADGQLFPIKEVSPQLQYHGLQLGQQQVQMRNLQMPKEISVAVGGSASTWMLFPELPPGNHVPQLTLKLTNGGKTRDMDINAAQRDALGLKVQRIGPRGALGLISVAGSLDTINLGALVEEIDRLAAARIVRVVIRWDEGSSVVDPQLANWLHNAVTNLGRSGQVADGPFPPLPASLREVHLAAFPEVGNTRGMQQVYPGFAPPNPGAVVRSHKTEGEAVIAALRTAYEAIPRDELLQAIQSGSRLERAAALVAGGGRLEADKLPVLLKLAEDEDLLLQQGALIALGHFGEPAALERLLAFARKDVPALSMTAISALAASRFPAAHAALLELLHNESPESKKSIVRILAAYPRPIWSDAIYDFVKDSRSGLNVEALQALVQVGHPRLTTVLVDALKSSDAQLSQTALTVLASRTDRESEDIAMEYVLEQLKTTPATAVMLQLIGRIKDRRALPLLTAQFGRHDNKVALIQTLALLGDAETARFLDERYSQLQSHEKGEVLRSSARLDRAMFHRLAAGALATSDGSVINFALQGLLEDGTPEAIKVMTSALETVSNSFAWNAICNTLSQVATPAARAALVKARDSDNREKRNYAVSALRQLNQRSPGYQYLMQAQAFSQKQEWKEAVEQFDLALQVDPTLSDAYAERGHAHLHLGRTAEAGRDFDRGLELDPFNSLSLTGSCLAMVIGDGKHQEAVKKLEEARSRFARDMIFAYNAACVYGRSFERVKKDPESAERDKLLEQYRKASFDDLKASIQGGFDDFELMKKDPDLAPFQEMTEFQELMKAPPPPPPGAGRNRGGARAR